MARAIVVDPFAETLTEVAIDASDGSAIKDIYKHTHCDCITSVRVARHTVMFLDDNGLYAPDQRFFALEGYPQPLAGRGIIVGMDDVGNTTGTDIPLEAIKPVIHWLGDSIEFAGIRSEEPREEDGPFGRMTVLRSHATFRSKGE